ncbi:MAG: hypothetical protein LBG69_03470 [Zoogloeaceae bacterium]|jgi:hypothetical protein|nr:hypothetical protein [Zoogloeaceae bacterium]
MFPVFPFLAGLLAGAAIPGLIRKTKINARLEETTVRAREKLRAAAAGSLKAVQQKSAQWQDQILSDANAAPVQQPARKMRKAPSGSKAQHAASRSKKAPV